MRSGREGKRERRKERRGGEGERVGKRWQLLCSQLLPKYLLQTAACVYVDMCVHTVISLDIQP